MVLDGERLIALVRGARRTVLICAPFIKASAMRTLLRAINADVAVRIVTRWRAAEVALGVSDLEVLDVAKARPNTELRLLEDLHAKLYLADDKGLAGSANLTAAGLGWSARSNVELLFSIQKAESNVARLLRRLEFAVLATEEVREAVAGAAAELGDLRLDEGQEVAKEQREHRPWLPRCAAPDKLFVIYQDPSTDQLTPSAKGEGLADLGDMDVPSGLAHPRFNEAVRETLRLMPAFRRIVDEVPSRLTDKHGLSLIRQVRNELTEAEASIQWQIVRDWIAEFFRSEYEVAPDSFVVRPR